MDAKLKKQRAALKGSLTRIETFVDSNAGNNIDISEFITRESYLQKTFEQYCVIQEQLEEIDESEAADMEKTEKKYLSTWSKLKSNISRQGPHMQQTPTQAQGSTMQNNPRLPNLNTPSFSGKIEDWQSFIDLFNAIIDSSNLDNVQKFLYLKGALSGEALKLINDLPLTNDNYINAIQLLKNRFENKLIVINAHLKGMLDVPNITKGNGKQLRHFLTHIKQHLNSLKALNLPVKEWDVLLIFLFTQKLDFQTHKAYELEKTIGPTSPILPSVDEFIQFLEKRCVALENIEGETLKGTNSGVKYSKQTLLGHQQRSQQQIKYKCIFCNREGHNIVKCFKFLALSLGDRRQAVQSLRLCYVCLGNMHGFAQCSERGCQVCNKKHHVLLHDDSYKNSANQDPRNQKDNSENISNKGENSGEHQTNGQGAGHSGAKPKVFLGVSEGVSVHIKPDDQLQIPSESSDLDEYIGISHGTDMGFGFQNINQTAFVSSKSQILLATAMVNVITSNGNKVEARALLDSGSQTSFITKNLFQKLNNVDFYSTMFKIGGIGNSITEINKMAKLEIEYQANGYKFDINCAVLHQITCELPHVLVDTNKVNIPGNILLADSEYFKPSRIDMLISAELYFDLLIPEIVKLGKGLPTLQNSKLGWLIGGSAPMKFGNNRSNNLLSIKSADKGMKEGIDSCVNVDLFCHDRADDINDLIPRFWQMEEITREKFLSPDEKFCEKLFLDSTKRLEDGRFQVDLPMRNGDEVRKLGNSFDSAVKRFNSLEKKFSKNTELYSQYKNFINEYVELGHGKYVDMNPDMNEDKRVFLAHHCVIRDEALTTKLRVVFDASSKTSTGYSLNDIMLKGYTVQPELFDILCRFRSFKFVFATDIQKMYRMISVNPKQRYLQNIIWRENISEQIKVIELQTVTYGTNSAPFLATRCLNKLATDLMELYPIAAQAILRQCYVDDILCGAGSKTEAIELKEQLTKLLNSGGFTLHKWCANDMSLLNDVMEIKEINGIDMSDANFSNKVLGVVWYPNQDIFKVSVPITETNEGSYEVITKRAVLSKIAQMYDPLGLVGPVVVRAKILMQEIWSSKIDWDDKLPASILDKWKNFSQNIHYLNSLEIPRYLFSNCEFIEIQIHGFADASLAAYGACVYVRGIYSNNTASSSLLCSKSRIAPLKTISLPRLELCGALLLARLVSKVTSVLQLKITKTYLWTDSQIVLSWLKGTPNRWTTFVANRVAEIQELTINGQWNHIKSEENPADCLSRGITSQDILTHTLWWQGPTFLVENLNLNIVDIRDDDVIENLPEQRKVTLSQTVLEPLIEWARFSKFGRLQRAVAYCLRFGKKSKITGPISVQELELSLHKIIVLIQTESFPKEIEFLKTKNRDENVSIFKNSSLKCLNPFLDHTGVMRVNGRLSKANIDYNQKFPIVLPVKHHAVRLIIQMEHIRLFHAGPQAVLANLRLQYWPIHGMVEVKFVLRKCVICHRFKSKTSTQLMGSLPLDRISVARPFLKVGIDFGGPILIKQSRLRSTVTTKAYIALFVCMVTKAIHLELVSSLSSESFLHTLKRFIARRGCPITIYSDNATNFQGANNVLKEIYLFFKSQNNLNTISDFLANQKIEWKFIPPLSPHWGGLWEAGIKSTKFHLKRVVGNLTLSFEEMITVLAQIEAILNSRPLCSVSSDPSDLECLTPGHFLIGQPLTSYPEKDISNIPENRLSFWQLCSRIKQNFWDRWSREYLSRLQARPKWCSTQQNLKKDMVVLVKEDNLSPLKWALGRILETLPGSDTKVRMVKIRTKEGVFMRPITKICQLPLEEQKDG